MPSKTPLRTSRSYQDRNSNAHRVVNPRAALASQGYRPLRHKIPNPVGNQKGNEMNDVQREIEDAARKTNVRVILDSERRPVDVVKFASIHDL
jgi:hypothetical protein